MRIISALGWPLTLLRIACELVAQRRARARLEVAHRGLILGQNVEIRSPRLLKLGNNVQIDKGTILHCGGMEWSEGKGHIYIGDASYIGPNCVLFGAGEIEIGAHVLISPGVVLASHQHSFERADLRFDEQPSQFARIVIEDNVWIGSNATILPGVRIGEGAIVGAGAVVTRDVAGHTLVLGVPARVARRLKECENTDAAITGETEETR